MTRAWARFRAPASKALSTWPQRSWRAEASDARRRTAPWASRVSTATQVAVDRAPVVSAMSSEAARSRRSQASARARTFAEWASAACLCSTDMYIGSTPVISSNAASIAA